MRTVTGYGLVALCLLWSQAQAEDRKTKEKADTTDLVGTYRVVSGERAGREIAADRVKEVAVRIGKDAITTFDKDKRQLYAATYALDKSQKPWRVRMTATFTPADGKGARAEGLLEKEGDTVRLIYALPGGEAPTRFKTGEQQQMFVLRKSGK